MRCGGPRPQSVDEAVKETNKPISNMPSEPGQNHVRTARSSPSLGLFRCGRRCGAGKVGLSLGIPRHICPRVLLKLLPVLAVLVRDAGLEGVVGLRLDKQLAHGLEDGGHLCCRFPVLGLQQGEADAARGVVCDVGVVNAGGEADGRGLEGVVGREVNEQAEGAVGVSGAGGSVEGDGPVVDVGLALEGDGDAGGRGGGALGEFLDAKCQRGRPESESESREGRRLALVMRLLDMMTVFGWMYGDEEEL